MLLEIIANNIITNYNEFFKGNNIFFLNAHGLFFVTLYHLGMTNLFFLVYLIFQVFNLISISLTFRLTLTSSFHLSDSLMIYIIDMSLLKVFQC
jgi:hypothetical protein